MRRAAGAITVLLGIVGIGLVLRGPVIAAAPVVDDVAADLVLTSAQVGLLTSLPVLCFALATPFASWLIGRVGANVGATITLAGVAIALVLRSSLPGLVGVFGATVLLGVAITVGNIVVPVLIRRDVAPQYAAIATGLFTCSLNIGSAAVTIGTAPVAALAGWRIALAASLLLVVIAATGWVLAAGRGAFSGTVAPRFETGVVDVVAAAPGRRRFAPTRSGLVIVLLTTAFCGQAFAYYATTSWLPQLLADEIGQTPGEAGSSAAVFQLAAIIGGLGVPLLISRTSPVVTAVVVGLCWATIPAGLILAPEAWLLWSIVGGAAQGGGFTVVFTLIVRIARTSLEARRSSAVVQGVAYTVAAASPAVIGAIHDAVGGWTVPMLGVAFGVTAFLVCGTAAAVLAQPPKAAAAR